MLCSRDNGKNVVQGPIRMKLVIVGDAACGKTCLLLKFSSGEFSFNYIPTVFENYVADLKVRMREIGFFAYSSSHCGKAHALFVSYNWINKIWIAVLIRHSDSL